MSRPYKAPELVKPRSNPSETEVGRKLNKRETTKYKLILITGISLFIATPVVTTLLVMGIIPSRYQFLFVIFGIAFFASMFLIDIGITKGKDKRPHRGIND